MQRGAFAIPILIFKLSCHIKNIKYDIILFRSAYGTFRVKVPQKRGGSDSPAPLNGLGFHPKTPCNNQIIQTTGYRNIFQTKTENKPFAEKVTFTERVKGKALVVVGRCLPVANV